MIWEKRKNSINGKGGKNRRKKETRERQDK